MMKYKVMITETLQRTVLVEAEDETEAHDRVSDAWSNSECILVAEDFQGVEFHVVGEADGSEIEKYITRIDKKDIERGGEHGTS